MPVSDSFRHVIRPYINLNPVPSDLSPVHWWILGGVLLGPVLIHKWIFFGTLLHLAYESTLLSSLVPIRYEDTIDGIFDLDHSGLPLMIWNGSSLHQSISMDSRPIMRRIIKRCIFVSLGADGIPKWAMEM